MLVARIHLPWTTMLATLAAVMVVTGCAESNGTHSGSDSTLHHQRSEGGKIFFGVLADHERLLVMIPEKMYQRELESSASFAHLTQGAAHPMDYTKVASAKVSEQDINMVPLVCSYFPEQQDLAAQNEYPQEEDQWFHQQCIPIFMSHDREVLSLSYLILNQTSSYAQQRHEYINQAFASQDRLIARVGLLMGWSSLPGVTIVSLSKYQMAHFAKWGVNQAPVLIPMLMLGGLMIATSMNIGYERALMQQSVHQLWQDELGRDAPLIRQHQPYGIAGRYHKHLLKNTTAAKVKIKTFRPGVYELATHLAQEYNETVILYGQGEPIAQMCLPKAAVDAPQGSMEWMSEYMRACMSF